MSLLICSSLPKHSQKEFYLLSLFIGIDFQKSLYENVVQNCVRIAKCLSCVSSFLLPPCSSSLLWSLLVMSIEFRYPSLLPLSLQLPPSPTDITCRLLLHSGHQKNNRHISKLFLHLTVNCFPLSFLNPITFPIWVNASHLAFG